MARAVYSSARILLLDDIFSALDVHTSRWIMTQCLAGPLLRGRTVLLVTHNVVLASPFARFMVVLSPSGSVQNQGVVESVLKHVSVLDSAKAGEMNQTGQKELSQDQAEEQDLLQKGKQIMDL